MRKTSFKWKNADGCVTAGTMLLLFLVVATAYLAIKFVPPYFHYYMLKGEVEAEAEGAHLHYDQDIIRNIRQRVKEAEMPVKEEGIILERRENEIEISINYEEKINFFNKYYKTLFFNIHTIKPIKVKQ